MYGSITRQLVHLIADPDVIYFGDGLPAWELFTVNQIKEIREALMEKLVFAKQANVY
jgi:hypothetical protein